MDTLRNQLDIVLSTGLVLFCSVRPAADVELQSSYSIHWNAVAPKRGFNCIWQRHHNIFSIIDDRKRFRIPWPTLNQHLRKFPFSILARSMSLAGHVESMWHHAYIHTYISLSIELIACETRYGHLLPFIASEQKFATQPTSPTYLQIPLGH